MGHTHTHTFDIKKDFINIPGAIMRYRGCPFQPGAFFCTFCDRSHVLEYHSWSEVVVSDDLVESLDEMAVLTEEIAQRRREHVEDWAIILQAPNPFFCSQSPSRQGNEGALEVVGERPVPCP